MNKKIVTALSGVVVIGAVVTWLAYKNNQQYESATTTPVDTTPVPTTAKPEEATVSGNYKDGTYTAAGSYFVPNGSEEIGVTVTLKNDVITDAQFIANARRDESQQFQDAFAQGFKTKVVGKTIDAVSLTVVNGSSLTPKGFMDALEKIKTQAKA